MNVGDNHIEGGGSSGDSDSSVGETNGKRNEVVAAMRKVGERR